MESGFVGLVVAAMGEPGDPALAGVGDEELEARLRRGAADVAAATCRWLELVAEVVRRGIWARQGAATPADWLSWAVSMGGSTAREHIRVALALREFPAVHARFRQGSLSYSKVRAITRIGRPELEELLLTYADHATGAQLERIARDLRRAEARRVVAEADPWDRRRLWSVVDGGMGEIRVRLPREVALRVEATLTHHAERLRAEVKQDPDADVPRPDRLLADAFVDAVDALAASGPVDRSGADQHLLVLHADHADVLDALPDEAVEVEVRRGSSRRHHSMSARTLRRIACDASLAVCASGDGGRVTAISGTTQALPARIRRALLERDRTCRFPTCNRTRGLHGHHIIHWANGGPTELHNLVALCAHHHTFVHERRWTIHHDGRGHVRFEPPIGSPVPSVAAMRPGASRAVDRASAEAELQPRWDGRVPDYDECVSVLMDAIDRLAPPDELVEAA